tara:strand:+ start:22118 stop:22558 length:441 start_codon:yes stop_codon:yes gene_type:complete
MSNFTTTWKRSTQPRKQRKYRYNAPLHVKQKFMHVHLAKDLRTKHGFRNIQVKTGDKVKIMRGSHKGKEGKVEKVSLKKEKIYITGIENVRKEGSKTLIAFTPSNLQITTLNLEDKKRKAKLESKKIIKKPTEGETKNETSKNNAS